jgi:hypothetical protein
VWLPQMRADTCTRVLHPGRARRYSCRLEVSSVADERCAHLGFAASRHVWLLKRVFYSHT